MFVRVYIYVCAPRTFRGMFQGNVTSNAADVLTEWPLLDNLLPHSLCLQYYECSILHRMTGESTESPYISLTWRKKIVIKCRFNYFNSWQCTCSQHPSRGDGAYSWGAGDLDLGVSMAYSSMTVSVFKPLICIHPCKYIFSLPHLVISSSTICTTCQATYSQGHVLDLSLESGSPIQLARQLMGQ